MRPEHDRLLPRSREGAGAGAGAGVGAGVGVGAGAGAGAGVGAGAASVRLLVPGFSYKTTAYVLWRRGARKPLQPHHLAVHTPTSRRQYSLLSAPQLTTPRH